MFPRGRKVDKGQTKARKSRRKFVSQERWREQCLSIRDYLTSIHKFARSLFFGSEEASLLESKFGRLKTEKQHRFPDFQHRFPDFQMAN